MTVRVLDTEGTELDLVTADALPRVGDRIYLDAHSATPGRWCVVSVYFEFDSAGAQSDLGVVVDHCP